MPHGLQIFLQIFDLYLYAMIDLTLLQVQIFLHLPPMPPYGGQGGGARQVYKSEICKKICTTAYKSSYKSSICTCMPWSLTFTKSSSACFDLMPSPMPLPFGQGHGQERRKAITCPLLAPHRGARQVYKYKYFSSYKSSICTCTCTCAWCPKGKCTCKGDTSSKMIDHFW